MINAGNSCFREVFEVGYAVRGYKFHTVMFPDNFLVVYFSSLLVMLSISTLQRPSLDPRPFHGGIYGGHSGSRTDFSLSTLVFSVIVIQPVFNTHISFIHH